MNERTLKLIGAFYERNPHLLALRDDISSACGILMRCYDSSGKLLVCGNGGSCADADHIVGELMKGFLLRRPLGEKTRVQLEQTFGERGAEIAKKLQGGLPAISLGAHAALGSAFSNDVDPALVYAQQTLAYAGEHDVLLGISTSGNAENVCAAMMTANVCGAARIGLTGRDGGLLAPLCDCAIVVPARETYLIQEEHLKIYHLICAYVESERFES